ncbi:hypothetical protein OPKNFCMD_4570 [Methylobacterium crusticola]|uniref:Uncharacterized protein n=1 Tax=Methylobacterium crusticola TaxID=1697972 RepID=A0ABQ4R2C3_9HYPH|nr:hypothetical protein [Methylobacterium crusticola]GJD51811.1 hypothetical protein OPKNFCMD_4570 [Methylobacterium crusticola]
MEYVCDVPGGKTWFRIETESEAIQESALMGHAVEKHFRQALARAEAAYVPPPGPWIEQQIGLKAHLRRTMPMFLTLRDPEGNGLATAMVPAGAGCPIIVGVGNRDPYAAHAEAIRRLGAHLGLSLERARCYPYGRD